MKTFTLTILAAAATATPVLGQNVCEAFRGAPPVGSWVEYRFSGQGQSGRTRMAVVGSETRGGRDFSWYEMSFQAMGQTTVAKILAEGGFYHAMSESKIEEMVIQMGSQPAMTISGPMLEQVKAQMNVGDDPAAQFSQGCEDAERVGVESVTVPAGTFRAVRYRLHTGANPGDAWLVEDMPFGLVKWEGSRGESATLVDHGSDAVSRIR